jgi:phytoene dehydrogenase-like protein
VAAAWKRKDYIIDGGIHFIMGHKPGKALYELYRELGIAQTTRFVDMITYGRFVDEASRRSVEVTQDLNSLKDDLKRFSPADAHVIDELIVGAHAMQEFDMVKAGLSKPPELKNSWINSKKCGICDDYSSTSAANTLILLLTMQRPLTTHGFARLSRIFSFRKFQSRLCS